MTDTHSQRIGCLSSPLAPKPTGQTPVLPAMTDVRAVVFDVYGTLLVSASGDISLASEGSRGQAATEALRGQGVELSIPGDKVVTRLLDEIKTAHVNSPEEFPEVEIRDVWRNVLKGLGFTLGEDAIERIAIDYECRVNPTWPMPGLAETLDTLAGMGMLLGIVSNAQFFTPISFDPLTGKSLEAWGFDARLCVWSYEYGQAKPGVPLYERCATALAERGVLPQEALYVGNDMRNDVWPSHKVGFRTALFAGDARSLRLREDDPSIQGVEPDAVITELTQILQLVSLRGSGFTE